MLKFYIQFGRREERGLALVTTLWILAILIVVAAGFTMTVRTETKIAENFGRRMQARALARAGLQRALLALQNDETPYTARGEPWEEITPDLDALEFETGTYRVEGSDESAKVNINVAPEEQLLALLQDEELRDALLDWRDDDDLPRLYGAESDYYLSLEPPYYAKNGLLDTLGEMLLIRGVTPELFYGAEGMEGEPPRGSLINERPPLQNLCTIYSEDTNLDAFRRSRLNIQTATEEEFQQRLGEVLSEEEIQAILRFRDRSSGPEGPEQPGGGGPSFPGGGGPGPRGISSSRQSGPPPSNPPLGPPGGGEGSEGSQPGGPPGGAEPGGGEEATEESPFRRTGDILQVPELSRERVQEIFDFLTVTDAETIPGRINLNTADPWVLLSLPGINEAAVEDILRYRESTDGPFESVGELLQLDSIPDEMFAAIADRVTTRSYSFHLQAQGWVAQEQIVQTVECVVRIIEPPAPESQGEEGELISAGELPPRQIEILYWRQ